MYLIYTLNDQIERRPFRTASTLSSQDYKHILNNDLIDFDCIDAYCVINQNLVPRIYEELQIESLPLARPKPLRGFDEKLSENPITHCLLPNLIICGHKKATYPILIAPLGQYDFILKKPWMNKYNVLLDIMKNKILFVPGRCNHEDNQASSNSELVFVSTTPSPQPPPIILKRSKPPSPSVEDDHNTLSNNSNTSRPSRYRTPSPRDTKKRRLKDPKYLDICEIDTNAFFINAKDKKNKLFSLTLNKVTF